MKGAAARRTQRPRRRFVMSSDQQAHTPGEADLTDHEYDGIAEYDNPMPRWWVWTFWGTFYFAIRYFLWFNVYFKGTPVVEEYRADMRAFREEQAKKELGAKVSEGALDKLAKNAVV